MPYCPSCGYDLESHAPGSTCPECGQRVDRPAKGPPPPIWQGVAALGLAAMLPALALLPSREPGLVVLIGATAAAVVFAIASVVQYRRNLPPLGRESLLLAVTAGVMPAVTLGLFLRVFVFGGSSNVPQLAGQSGADLWSLWANAWPLLLLGNPLSCVAAVAAAALPPYGPKFVGAWALPLATLVAAAAAAHLASVYFPDA